jgi:hypothetical protein
VARRAKNPLERKERVEDLLEDPQRKVQGGDLLEDLQRQEWGNQSL